MMKKRYSTPKLDLVLFESDENVMWNESGGEIPAPGPLEPANLNPGMGTGTVINNNGAPTFVPGGNGGGGRQTPLG